MRRLLDILSKVQMGFIFFAVLTPAAMFVRLLGKDPLKLKRDPEAETYWIPADKMDLEQMKYPF